MTTSPARSLVRPPHRRERVIEALLFMAAALGVLTTIGIVFVLIFQTIEFFQLVSPIDFLTGTSGRPRSRRSNSGHPAR